MFSYASYGLLKAWLSQASISKDAYPLVGLIDEITLVQDDKKLPVQKRLE